MHSKMRSCTWGSRTGSGRLPSPILAVCISHLDEIRSKSKGAHLCGLLGTLQVGANGHALVVYNDGANHTLVRANALERLLDFRLRRGGSGFRRGCSALQGSWRGIMVMTTTPDANRPPRPPRRGTTRGGQPPSHPERVRLDGPQNPTYCALRSGGDRRRLSPFSIARSGSASQIGYSYSRKLIIYVLRFPGVYVQGRVPVPKHCGYVAAGYGAEFSTQKPALH